jgi:hypothetical protein
MKCGAGKLAIYTRLGYPLLPILFRLAEASTCRMLFSRIPFSCQEAQK